MNRRQILHAVPLTAAAFPFTAFGQNFRTGPATPQNPIPHSVSHFAISASAQAFNKFKNHTLTSADVQSTAALLAMHFAVMEESGDNKRLQSRMTASTLSGASLREDDINTWVARLAQDGIRLNVDSGDVQNLLNHFAEYKGVAAAELTVSPIESVESKMVSAIQSVQPQMIAYSSGARLRPVQQLHDISACWQGVYSAGASILALLSPPPIDALFGVAAAFYAGLAAVYCG